MPAGGRPPTDVRRTGLTVAELTARATGWLSGVWRWPAKWRPGVARFVVTVTGILATAFAGLVIEDWFPNDPQLPPIDVLHTTGWRFLCLAATALTFGWVFWSGIWRNRTQGTLIYALFLSRGNVDRHSESAASSGRDRPAFRSIFRRCPTPAGLSADVSEQVEEFSDRLTEMIHADDPNTATTLAPNMLLPIGIAAGWRLTPPEGLRFLEIDTRVEFTVDDLNRAWDAPASAGWAVVDDSTDPPADQNLPTTSGPIWLDIYLSNRPYQRQDYLIGFPPPAVRRTIGVPDPAQADTFTAVNSGAGSGDLDPAQVAVRIAKAIQHEAAKGRVVLLTGRMPKTVNLAIGWLLWHQRAEARDATGRPLQIWQRLVPLMWTDDERPFRYLRVDAAQPAAADLGITA